MANKYNITTAPRDIDSMERSIRERWTEQARAKNDRIIGNGYAERQIADTLSKVEPIDVNISKVVRKRDDLVKRGHVIDALAATFENSETMKGVFSALLEDVPGIKPNRAKWVRDTDTARRAPGLRRFFCSGCYCYNDTCTPYCPNCGASMRRNR